MVAALVAMGFLVGCTGSGSSSPPEAEAPAPAPAEEEVSSRALFMVQAHFAPDYKPLPAKGVLYRRKGQQWQPEILEDPDSNVWHKATFYRDGILTIGGDEALLKHWTKGEGGWTGKTLYEASFGGKFDRFRDFELGDVDGDGADEIVIATHDFGVVAVGDEQDDGTWSFQQFDKKADTFVHEVEIGDVDGDGKNEFYVTPSDRNKASGASQPGGVYRYDHQPDGTYARRSVVAYADTHAKEILVTDLDGDGTDELYIAKEGVTVVEGGKKLLKAPVTIERYTADASGSLTRSEVGVIPGESQCRFLVAGDVDGDESNELIAASKDTGLWLAEATDTGFAMTRIAEKTGGFEHATHLADLDEDGKLEIYVASELKDHRLLRRYVFDGEGYRAEVIAPIPEQYITWNLADGTLP